MTIFHVLTFHDLRALVGDRYGRFDVPCPACGPLCRAASNRRRPVLRVWREEAEFISFYCARCGQRGFAKDFESPTPAPRDLERAKARAAAAVQRQHADLARNTARALAIWNDAQPICSTLAEHYLKRRGLFVPDESGRVLRFHPWCPFGDRRRLPSMVVLMRNIHTDAPQAISRTALSPDGERIERKMQGPKRGAAVKLSPDESVTMGLTIGEGVETTLAGMERGFSPAWALGDAGNIAGFHVLSGIEAITILADNDTSGTGQRAAETCARRWVAAGREARLLLPHKKGADFNDITVVV
jgi:hypothetical protein